MQLCKASQNDSKLFKFLDKLLQTYREAREGNLRYVVNGKK